MTFKKTHKKKKFGGAFKSEELINIQEILKIQSENKQLREELDKPTMCYLAIPGTNAKFGSYRKDGKSHWQTIILNYFRDNGLKDLLKLDKYQLLEPPNASSQRRFDNAITRIAIGSGACDNILCVSTSEGSAITFRLLLNEEFCQKVKAVCFVSSSSFFVFTNS